MAHNLETNNGEALMVYAAAGGTPWHKLGTAIPNNVTAAQALVLAGMDTTVVLKQALAIVDGVYKPIPGAQSVVRQRDGLDLDVLATVGMAYAPIQNAKLAEWADALSRASEGRAHVEAAGSLDGGRRVWMLMRHNGTGSIKLAGDDSPILKNLLLASSFDGSLNMSIMCTGVRVVCQNTLDMALKGAMGRNAPDRTIAIRHTSGAAVKMDDAIKSVGKCDDYFTAFEKLADGLTRTPYSRDKFSALVDGLLNIKPSEDHESKLSTKTANARDKLVDLLDTTPGAQPGTAWGAYNAIVDYADHHAPMRLNGRSEAEGRCSRLLQGAAVELKNMALDLICASTKEQWGTLQLKEIAAKTSGNSDLLADICAATRGE